MKKIQKYVAAFAIALLTGLGIFTVSTAINAQTTEKKKQETQTEKTGSKQKLTTENEDDDDEESEEADENESEEGEKSEASEQEEQAALAKLATITRAQAEKIALKHNPGIVVEGELEKEDKVLLYSFEIKNADNTLTEVEVDAKSGAVIKSQPENEDETSEGEETGVK